ncbi:unnamed protein product [Peniophora sp. CBMAI 1063]|nr:unnamed protein product [Peniophora sp. CBMAI 1063]
MVAGRQGRTETLRTLLAAGTLVQCATTAQAAQPASSGKNKWSKGSNTASGGASGSGNGSGNVCTWCKANGRSGKGHTVANCFNKRVSDLEAAVRARPAAGNAADASGAAFFGAAGKFASTATAASSLSASPAHTDLFDDSWNVDTSATAHMTPHCHWFATYRPFRMPICLANGVIVYSAGLGSVVFEPEGEGVDGQPIELTRVLHVPQLCANLLSVLYLSLHC